ncbi:MAG: polysaccharide deacetylase family protein [Candidatus Latescibacteria bacterium]|nr:polysaccharide deacetylase family protein [Candidatus Latescibacterota bacterium]
MPRLAVVSVHDVTPAHEDRLRRIMVMLAESGVTRTSMLVIPDFHRGWDLRSHPRFVDWLHQLEADGHEIVLHGLYHSDPTPSAGTVYQKLLRHVYSKEGEFYTLSYQEAVDRLTQGLEMFTSLGFTPCGFVSPAWMHNEEVVRAVQQMGFRYLTSLGGFTDLTTDRTIRAPAVCFSPRTWTAAAISTLYCVALARLVDQDPVVRIAIHPGDIVRPMITARLLSILDRTRRTRRFVAYQDLLEAPVR